MGTRALGRSAGVDVKVLRETPGPHSIRACKPGEGKVACGIVRSLCDQTTLADLADPPMESESTLCFAVDLSRVLVPGSSSEFELFVFPGSVCEGKARISMNSALRSRSLGQSSLGHWKLS